VAAGEVHAVHDVESGTAEAKWGMNQTHDESFRVNGFEPNAVGRHH
jgi:hypothetical protein